LLRTKCWLELKTLLTMRYFGSS